jgi:hypothetical protein
VIVARAAPGRLVKAKKRPFNLGFAVVELDSGETIKVEGVRFPQDEHYHRPEGSRVHLVDSARKHAFLGYTGILSFNWAKRRLCVPAPHFHVVSDHSEPLLGTMPDAVKNYGSRFCTMESIIEDEHDLMLVQLIVGETRTNWSSELLTGLE